MKALHRSPHRFSGIAALVGSLALLAACQNSDPSDQTPESDAGVELAPSPTPNLQWKRYAALEADVARALELDRDDLCQELGRASCVREVHLVSLGGHDPFETGLLSPSKEPLATTPTAVDRVLLSACSKRVLADEEAGQEDAEVFRHFDLSKNAPAADSDAVHDTLVALYRRFLSRNPDTHELPLVASLVEDDEGERRKGRDFAVLSCFAIGTTTEFLFF